MALPGLRQLASGASRAAEISAVLTLATVTLSLGGAPVWALWPMVIGCCLTLALALAGTVGTGGGVRITGAVKVLAAVVAVIALQLVPLPAGVLRIVSPEAAELRAFVLAPLGFSESGAVSQDVPATLRALAFHVSLLALLFGVSQLARSERVRRRLAAGIVLVGVAVAAITLGHAVFAAHHYFGVYEFSHRGASLLSPFGNPNHLAAFQSLAAILALGLALSTELRNRAFLWGLAFLINGLIVALSLSRGGIAFFGLGLVLFAFWTWRARAEKRDPRTLVRWAATIGAGVVVLGFVAAYLAWDQLVVEAHTVDSLEKLEAAKIDLWPMLWSAATHYPVGGMGRGAFEAVFPRYQTALPTATLTHPENLVLQLGAELGLIPALLLFGAAIWVLARAFRRNRSSTLDLALWAALVATVLHDLFDFSLELPPTAIAAVLLVALVCRPRRGAESSSRSTVELTPRRLAVVAGPAVACAVIAVSALAVGQSTLADSEAAVFDARKPETTGAQLLEVARPHLARHPADYLLYEMVAGAYASGPRKEASQALALANRAFFLRPLDANAHLIAARALLQLGHRSQAMLEYRLAYEAGNWRVLDESVPVARTLDELRRIVPLEPKAVASVAMKLWSAKRGELARGVLESAMAQLGEGPESLRLWTQASLYALHSKDAVAAEALARDAVRMDPSAAESQLALARVLKATGRTEEAVTALQEGTRANPDNLVLSIELARALHVAGRRKEAWEVTKRMSPFANTVSERASLFAFEGELLRRESRLFRAADKYSSALHLQPKNLSYRTVLAQIYEAQHRPDDALREVREIVRLRGKALPHEIEWEARLEEQEKAFEARKLELHLRDPALLGEEP